MHGWRGAEGDPHRWFILIPALIQILCLLVFCIVICHAYVCHIGLLAKLSPWHTTWTLIYLLSPIDQDPAMPEGIKKVFPKTIHWLCRWHVLIKFMPLLNELYARFEDFKTIFHSVISHPLTVEEFEQAWRGCWGSLNFITTQPCSPSMRGTNNGFQHTWSRCIVVQWSPPSVVRVWTSFWKMHMLVYQRLCTSLQSKWPSTYTMRWWQRPLLLIITRYILLLLFIFLHHEMIASVPY